jgi:hypothetical protein
MKEQLIKAARMHAEGELERAKTNVMVYMKQSVGIGEHSDIVEAIQKELDTMAMATDRIEMLDKHFANNSIPLFEDAADEGLYTPS